MTGITREMAIKSDSGESVSRMNLRDSVLEGRCEWYDGWNNLVSYGVFRDGIPFTGTFLNWTRFFGHLRQEHPYDPTVYCQDWITIFEAGFDSEPPKYEMVL